MIDEISLHDIIDIELGEIMHFADDGSRGYQFWCRDITFTNEKKQKFNIRVFSHVSDENLLILKPQATRS